jgi:hypothetical protein
MNDDVDDPIVDSVTGGVRLGSMNPCEPTHEESRALVFALAYLRGDPAVVCETWGADIFDPSGVQFWSSEEAVTFCFRPKRKSEVEFEGEYPIAE